MTSSGGRPVPGSQEYKCYEKICGARSKTPIQPPSRPLPPLSSKTNPRSGGRSSRAQPQKAGRAVRPPQTQESICEEENIDVRRELDLEDIDPFDFDGYPRDFELFSEYFDGIEKYLRLAIWILYKYAYLPEEDREKLHEDLERSRDRRDFLVKLTDAFRAADLPGYWYIHWNPAKATKDFIQETLNRYIFCEDVLFNRLYKIYVDPDWEETKLWFADCPRRKAH